MIRRALIGLPAAALALFLALQSAPAIAQTPTQGAPVIVYQSLKDGDVITEPVFGIQMCFAAPINIKDLDKGGDFAFSVTQPDGIGLGHRDVFQRDGYGYTIYPGNPVGSNTTGQWKFTYRVTSPDATQITSGTINYTVDPGGTTMPRETPPVCVASGGTETASPVASGGASPTPAGSASPAPSGSATPKPSGTTLSPSGSPSATPVPGDTESSGPDILKLALLTIGAAGAAAVLLLIGFGIRRAVGFDWHKPGPGGGDSGHH